MNKYILTLILSTILLHGVNIDFKEMDKNPTREKAKENTIISYHQSIQNGIKSVVNISAKRLSNRSKQDWKNHPFYNDPFFRQFFDKKSGKRAPQNLESSLGSGVIVSEDGYIVTNNHVISEASEIVVTLPNSKKEYKAKIIGTDPRGDLAVIKIKGKGLSHIVFADSKEAKVGDIVFAIGNPFGIGETVTKGIISAKNKSGFGINEYENFIQTDASINPGNSGGALVDSRGALVGISTAIISKGEGSVGIGFAIPSNSVKESISSLVATGRVLRGYLGINISNLDESLFAFYNSNRGALVTNVDTDTPAHRAGLKRGDLIINIEGDSINTANELKTKIGSYKPNSKIMIQVLRGKKKISKTVKLAEAPDKTEKAQSLKELEGLSLQELNPKTKKKYSIPSHLFGLLVVDVNANAKAYKNGFLAGDIITQVEDIKINTINQLATVFKKFQGQRIRIWIFRNGAYGVLVVDNE